MIMLSTLDMLWKGLAIGVIISAPMGPVGMLCIQKTIAKGRKAGFLTGCGAALSDILYCLLTGFGLSLIEEFLEQNQSVIQILGSIVLLFFGIYLFRQKEPKEYARKAVAKASVSKDALGGFLFTLSNPLIIFLIIGLFARFNFPSPGIKFYHYIAGYVAIIIGALAWWWVITFTIDKIRTHFNAKVQMIINRVIGIIIMIFAVVGIITASSDLMAAPRPPESHFNETFISDIVIDSQSSENSSTSEITAKLPDNGLPCRVLFQIAPPQKKNIFPNLLSGLSHDDTPANQWRISLIDENAPEKKMSIRYYSVERKDPLTSSSSAAAEFIVEGPDGKMLTTDVSECGNNSEGVFLLTRSGNDWTLSAGKHRPKQTVTLPETDSDFNPTIITLENLSDSKLKIPYFSVSIPFEAYEQSLAIKLKQDIDSIVNLCGTSSYVEHPTDGLWKMIYSEFDKTIAFPGGDYTLRIFTPQKGLHIMEYVSGAQTLSSDWKPGDLKGVLYDHESDLGFYLYWIDSEGNLVTKNLSATFDEQKQTLQLSFPRLDAMMTFRKISSGF
ncbi:MAG: LysE family translocator [Muribaculaceae bacterium]|nr:LysE family translocator [Muribaculaceae bacterium]